MILCKELPNVTFTDKAEMFKALVKHKDNIISLKKAAIQKSHEKGQLGTFELFKASDATKATFDMKEDYIYPVINTTKYLDSHGDVHMDGIWNKSVKEQKGNIFYVADHELKTNTVIAWAEDVNVMVKDVPWQFVGKNYEGNTQALIFEIPKSAIQLKAALDIIEGKRPVQNSVRMQYVKIKLAINSNEKDYAEFKANYDNTIYMIANKEVAEEQGYFWIVEEAKISKEGSMVLFGSNDATPIQYSDAEKITSEQEPPVGTRKTNVKIF